MSEERQMSPGPWSCLMPTCSNVRDSTASKSLVVKGGRVEYTTREKISVQLVRHKRANTIYISRLELVEAGSASLAIEHFHCGDETGVQGRFNQKLLHNYAVI